MEKMITIFAEVAVATIILFGLVSLASNIMEEPTADDAGGVIYTGLNDVINSIFDSAKEAAGIKGE